MIDNFINVKLISNPLNWFIVTLMVVIGTMAINEGLKLLHVGVTVPGFDDTGLSTNPRPVNTVSNDSSH